MSEKKIHDDKYMNGFLYEKKMYEYYTHKIDDWFYLPVHNEHSLWCL